MRACRGQDPRCGWRLPSTRSALPSMTGARSAGSCAGSSEASPSQKPTEDPARCRRRPGMGGRPRIPAVLPGPQSPPGSRQARRNRPRNRCPRRWPGTRAADVTRPTEGRPRSFRHGNTTSTVETVLSNMLQGYGTGNAAAPRNPYGMRTKIPAAPKGGASAGPAGADYPSCRFVKGATWCRRRSWRYRRTWRETWTTRARWCRHSPVWAHGSTRHGEGARPRAVLIMDNLRAGAGCWTWPNWRSSGRCRCR